MTLPSSGLITAAMINVELGRSATAPLNLNDSVVRQLAGVSAGPYGFNSFYGKAFDAVVTISSHTAQQSAQNYFTTADWTNAAKRKIINVTGGAHLWSYTQGIPGFRTGTGRAGELHINLGSGCYILGHAGQPNAGVGGTALLLEQGAVYLTNNGGIFGGGGAGGYGGQGGTGWYTAQEGPAFQEAYYEFSQTSWGWYEILWAGGRPIWPPYSNAPFSVDGYTYYQGAGTYTYGRYNAWAGSYGNHVGAAILRQFTAYAAGGAGGSGGWGVGYNSGLSNMYTAGSPGAAAGGNAGTGGTGGAGGGNWGATGGTGATGNSGNAAGGAAGQAGGLGGYYIQNSGYLAAYTNNGTVLGRIV